MRPFTYDEFQMFGIEPVTIMFDDKYSYGSKNPWVSALTWASQENELPDFVLYACNDNRGRAEYNQNGIDCCLFIHGNYHAAYVNVTWEAFFSMSKANRRKLENYKALKYALMNFHRIDIERLDCEHYQIESLYKLITNQKGMH